MTAYKAMGLCCFDSKSDRRGHLLQANGENSLMATFFLQQKARYTSKTELVSVKFNLALVAPAERHALKSAQVIQSTRSLYRSYCKNRLNRPNTLGSKTLFIWCAIILTCESCRCPVTHC